MKLRLYFCCSLPLILSASLRLCNKTRLSNCKIRIWFFTQLVSKVDELLAQLTSDEPRENVDASNVMMARQQQIRDSIISGSAKVQKEGQVLLDELRRVSWVKYSCDWILDVTKWWRYEFEYLKALLWFGLFGSHFSSFVSGSGQDNPVW